MESICGLGIGFNWVVRWWEGRGGVVVVVILRMKLTRICMSGWPYKLGGSIRLLVDDGGSGSGRRRRRRNGKLYRWTGEWVYVACLCDSRDNN